MSTLTLIACLKVDKKIWGGERNVYIYFFVLLELEREEEQQQEEFEREMEDNDLEVDEEDLQLIADFHRQRKFARQKVCCFVCEKGLLFSQQGKKKKKKKKKKKIANGDSAESRSSCPSPYCRFRF